MDAIVIRECLNEVVEAAITVETAKFNAINRLAFDILSIAQKKGDTNFGDIFESARRQVESEMIQHLLTHSADIAKSCGRQMAKDGVSISLDAETILASLLIPSGTELRIKCLSTFDFDNAGLSLLAHIGRKYG
jgi:hypothetical protein